MSDEAQNLCDWLTTKCRAVEANPVEVHIGKNQFVGALYTLSLTYEPSERAVTEGCVQTGERYFAHRFYCLGSIPKSMKGSKVFVWQHNLAIDSRVARSVGEWYIAGWFDKPNTRFDVHNPFGSWFGLHEWCLPSYGPYKDHLIDTLEPTAYRRQPMTVSFSGTSK